MEANAVLFMMFILSLFLLLFGLQECFDLEHAAELLLFYIFFLRMGMRVGLVAVSTFLGLAAFGF